MTGLGKPFRKKSDPKNRKNTKHQSEIAVNVNKKITSETANFCSKTVFSLYVKFRAKNFAPQTTIFFAPLPVSA